MSDPALIELRDVSKRDERPDGPSFDALKRVTCTIPARSMTAIVGRSGSGKSTLLHLIAGLDDPSAGSVDDLFFADRAPPSPDLEDLLSDPPRQPEETEAYVADLAERLYRYFETVAPLFVQLETPTAFHADHLAHAHPSVMGSGPVEPRRARLDVLAATGRIHKAGGSAMAQLLISGYMGESVSAAPPITPPDANRRREMIGLIWRGLKPTDTCHQTSRIGPWNRRPSRHAGRFGTDPMAITCGTVQSGRTLSHSGSFA